MNSAVVDLDPTQIENTAIDTANFNYGDKPTILSDIYQTNNNIVVWKRQFDHQLVAKINEFVQVNPRLSKSLTVSPDSAYADLDYATDGRAPTAMLEDMAQLVDMFCYLFELNQAGLRLATLNGAMCPRFHFDQVPCRLVTTYHGIGSQWLPNRVLDRTKLGHGSNGLSDAKSGLYQCESDIQQLECGDVALLKGGRWEGNENSGLVHRSPVVPIDSARLLLTLDFA